MTLPELPETLQRYYGQVDSHPHQTHHSSFFIAPQHLYIYKNLNSQAFHTSFHPTVHNQRPHSTLSFHHVLASSNTYKLRSASIHPSPDFSFRIRFEMEIKLDHVNVMNHSMVMMYVTQALLTLLLTASLSQQTFLRIKGDYHATFACKPLEADNDDEDDDDERNGEYEEGEDDPDAADDEDVGNPNNNNNNKNNSKKDITHGASGDDDDEENGDDQEDDDDNDDEEQDDEDGDNDDDDDDDDNDGGEEDKDEEALQPPKKRKK